MIAVPSRDVEDVPVRSATTTNIGTARRTARTPIRPSQDARAGLAGA
jgi:hypothetical protein